jgi:hypothetical protein
VVRDDQEERLGRVGIGHPGHRFGRAMQSQRSHIGCWIGRAAEIAGY